MSWKTDLHDYFKIAGNRRISDDLFNDIDCPRFSSCGNTRKELEIPAKRFVYDPTSAKAQSSKGITA